MPQFEAAGAQVLGVSADHAATLDAFTKQNPLKHTLASDFRRTMLPGYGAMVTDVGERDWSTPAVKGLLLEVLKQPAK